MKRISGFLIAALAAVLMLAACKEGPVGPMGKDGLQGPAGQNAGSTNFLVVFDTDGGLPAVNAAAVASGGKVTRPVDPVKPFTGKAGLYRGYPAVYTFAGWVKDDDTPYDFDTATVSGSITLTAKWTAPAVINIADRSETGVIAQAIGYIKAQPATPERAYTLLLDEDVNCAPQTLNAADIKLSLIGIGRERKINLSTTGALFTVGTSGQTGIELSLGKNITLVGRSVGGNGGVNNNASVVTVQDGAGFTMLEGSKITGNTSNNTGFGYGSAVYVSNAAFTMKGGVITGNTSTYVGPESTGGVYGTNATPAITMEGGSVTGNTATHDVNLFQSNSFELKGGATIGVLCLGAASLATTYSVTIYPGWTGWVGRLHLRASDASLTTTITWWSTTTNPVLKAATGYTLKAADVAKFPLGNFMCGTAGSTQPITGNLAGTTNYRIEDSETNGNIGKLVAVVPVTP